jgi:hypothetical protein
MDNLDFLDGAEAPKAETQPVETPPAAEAPAEAPAEATPAPEAEAKPEEKPAQPRGPDGKFAPKEAKPDVPQGFVPIGVVQELREEIRSLKQPAPEQAKVEPTAPPDIFENPEGYSAYLQNQIAQTTLNDRLNLSEELVRQSAGDEAVNAAQEWGRQQLASNPAFAQTFYAQRNPYGFLVSEHRRQTMLAQLGNADPKEIEAYLAWKTAQEQVQPAAQAAPPQQPAPPRSIADATSAGGVQHVAVGPGVAFSNVIK